MFRRSLLVCALIPFASSAEAALVLGSVTYRFQGNVESLYQDLDLNEYTQATVFDDTGSVPLNLTTTLSYFGPDGVGDHGSYNVLSQGVALVNLETTSNPTSAFTISTESTTSGGYWDTYYSIAITVNFQVVGGPHAQVLSVVSASNPGGLGANALLRDLTTNQILVEASTTGANDVAPLGPIFLSSGSDQWELKSSGTYDSLANTYLEVTQVPEMSSWLLLGTAGIAFATYSNLRLRSRRMNVL
ncbi:MAG: hypothetical protein U1D30_22060 [Planctomycetota bacterium]